MTDEGVAEAASRAVHAHSGLTLLFPRRWAVRAAVEAERARKREDLLAASEKNLAQVQAATTRGRNPLRGEAEIALKVGATLGRRKVAKHFRLTITDTAFGNQHKLSD